jgi:hypothetical protein
MSVLVALRIDENASKYKSFLHAIRTIWNAKKISDIKQRLDEIKTELHFRIQIMMKTDQIEMEANILRSLDDVSRHVLTAVLETKNDLVRRQKVSEYLAAKRHDEMIDLVANTRETEFRPLEFVTRLQGLLQHEKQNDRFDDIVAAHQTTFRWALQEDNSTNKSWPNLHNWLRQESGIYWISGKAGSGKSTLMKYLHKDPRLKAALKEWAGGLRLIVVHFYFWNAGSDLQKSQEGLLRGLLHQVLDQEPSLGPILFQEQFKLGGKWTASPRSMTFHQLRRAFHRLTSQQDNSIKIALLLDGLDEFDASDLTMTELAEMFIATTKSPNTKALVSSRPLAPFEYAFTNYPKLRLHELTYEDVRTYVDDRLATHPRITVLAHEDVDGAKALIDEIVTSASGVFLWVKLVVRSLLEGLQNYDKLPDLQKRLRELPRDLEDLFRHMLRNIPAEYKLESSQILQTFRAYEGYHDGTLHTVALTFAELDEARVLGADINALTDSEIQRYEEEVAGRLRSRCVGLLEVRSRHLEWGRPVHPFSVDKATMYIDYLHKSVADFLSREEIWNEVTSYTSGIDFDPNVSLLRSMVMQIKCIVPKALDMNLSTSELWKLVDKAMYFARLAEASTKVSHSALLNELDRTMSLHLETIKKSTDVNNLYRSAGGTIATWCDCVYIEIHGRDEPWHDDFLAFAIRHGLTLYVQERLEQVGRKGIQKKGRPLLDLACCPVQEDRWSSERVQTDIVASLLQYGADPNQKWGTRGTTIWQNALALNLRDASKWVAVLKHLALRGANPNAWVESECLDGIQKKNRKSPLRVIRTRSPLLLLQARLLEEESTMAWQKLKLQSAGCGTVPSQIEEKLAVEIKSLFSLLVARGAREEEWHEVENGIYKKVYPERSMRLQGKAPQFHRYISSKGTKPTRNPLKRMFKRLHRHQPEAI